MCPMSLIMAQSVCIGPRQCRGLIHASRAIITDRGQKTGTLGKHPYLNIFINQLEPLLYAYVSPSVRKSYFQNLSPVKY
jgi:hypothetical protein